MKFSTFLLLAPYLTFLALAAPRAQEFELPDFSDLDLSNVDAQCVADKCPAFAGEVTKCSKESSASEGDKVDAYKSCFCDGPAFGYYQECISCYKGEDANSLLNSVQGVCGKSTSSGKNSASGLQCNWKFAAGMAVAGGIVGFGAM
ncbi:hypothetical protein BDZ91DRAFT_853161 [Kalaharituber pfeilii]|nr:hypothetical protein BDZ91DRAFT_853161 [Kalaharituber pfeilii]